MIILCRIFFSTGLMAHPIADMNGFDVSHETAAEMKEKQRLSCARRSSCVALSCSLASPRLWCLRRSSCVCSSSIPQGWCDKPVFGLVHSSHWGGLVFVEELALDVVVVLGLQLQLLLDALDRASTVLPTSLACPCTRSSRFLFFLALSGR